MEKIRKPRAFSGSEAWLEIESENEGAAHERDHGKPDCDCTGDRASLAEARGTKEGCDAQGLHGRGKVTALCG